MAHATLGIPSAPASQLGGALTIASKPGLGTDIQLWLPVSLLPAEAGDDSDADAPLPEVVGTALLVNDEDLVRASTADMLQELGFKVIEASSAEEALRVFAGSLRPDVVITDHLMPGMTGVDLARNVQEREPGLPVLIVSGYAEAEGIAPDLPRLTKPFRQADLAAVLATVSPSRMR